VESAENMIIYPVIILVLLTIAFGIFWRRAYIIENGEPGLEGKKLEHDLKTFDTKIPAKKISEEIEDLNVDIKPEEEENFKKADELFSKKQFISAEKWYLEAAKKDPKNPKIYSRLGVIYIEQKNYKDAIEALSEAIRLDQNIARWHFNLSFAYNAEGDRKESVIHAKRALKLDPRNQKYKSWFDELRSKPF
jgi:tetratricopeptide (TPR) repeat protein